MDPLINQNKFKWWYLISACLSLSLSFLFISMLFLFFTTSLFFWPPISNHFATLPDGWPFRRSVRDPSIETRRWERASNHHSLPNFPSSNISFTGSTLLIPRLASIYHPSGWPSKRPTRNQSMEKIRREKSHINSLKRGGGRLLDHHSLSLCSSSCPFFSCAAFLKQTLSFCTALLDGQSKDQQDIEWLRRGGGELVTRDCLIRKRGREIGENLTHPHPVFIRIYLPLSLHCWIQSHLNLPSSQMVIQKTNQILLERKEGEGNLGLVLEKSQVLLGLGINHQHRAIITIIQ